MATKNTSKRKKLANPAVVAVVASKAGPAAKEGATQVNKDTKGALSWVIVAGVAILGIIVLKTVNNASKVSDVIGSGADAASSFLDQLTNAIKDPNLDATDSPISGAGSLTPSITEVEAQNKAILLYDAMNWPTTNFDRIKSALSNITLADYVLIGEKFGTPRYNEILGSGAYWPYPKRNLSYWIAAELDDDEINEIRTVLPGMF